MNQKAKKLSYSDEEIVTPETNKTNQWDIAFTFNNLSKSVNILVLKCFPNKM